MKVRPLHDRIIVQRVESSNTTRGGIIIPENAKEKPQEGIVIAVGNGRRNENGTITPLEVREKDLILFSKFSGSEVTVNGEKLLIIGENDVLAVLES